MQSASISFRTYALDLWGFGDTSKAPDYYNLDQQVALINNFLEEMGIGKVALIGHGLGAIVATLFANRFSRLVDRLMVVSMPDGHRPLNSRLVNSPPVELADWLLTRTSEGDAVRAEATKADQLAILSTINDLQRIDIVSLSQTLETPCLQLYGQNDPVLDGPPSIESISILPEHIHQMVFEQSGHFPMLDEVNKFNRLVADFLSLTSGISPRQLQVKEEWKRRIR
jgi:pimeloyl-ACP methyl ester carboxylesterase